MIKIDTVYLTKNKNTARVICVDAKAKLPVIALVTGLDLTYGDKDTYTNDDREKVLRYDAKGVCFDNTGCDNHMGGWDLVIGDMKQPRSPSCVSR